MQTVQIRAGQKIWRKLAKRWSNIVEPFVFQSLATGDVLFRVLPNEYGDLEINGNGDGMICLCKQKIEPDTNKSGWINFEIMNSTKNKKALFVKPNYGAFQEIYDRLQESHLVNYQMGNEVKNPVEGENYLMFYRHKNDKINLIIKVVKLFENVEKMPAILYYDILSDEVGLPYNKAEKTQRICGQWEMFVHGRISCEYTLHKLIPRPVVHGPILTEYILK